MLNSFTGETTEKLSNRYLQLEIKNMCKMSGSSYPDTDNFKVKVSFIVMFGRGLRLHQFDAVVTANAPPQKCNYA